MVCCPPCAAPSANRRSPLPAALLTPPPLPHPRSFLLWDGYGVLPNLCGTQYQQKKPAAAAAAGGEGEGGAAAPPSGGQQQQPQRTAALCSLPATSVVDMVRESKVRLQEGGVCKGGGGGAPGGYEAPGGEGGLQGGLQGGGLVKHQPRAATYRYLKTISAPLSHCTPPPSPGHAHFISDQPHSFLDSAMRPFHNLTLLAPVMPPASIPRPASRSTAPSWTAPSAPSTTSALRTGAPR